MLADGVADPAAVAAVVPEVAGTVNAGGALPVAAAAG